MTFEVRYDDYLVKIGNCLEAYFPKTAAMPQERLFEAMRYSLFAGGKRIRPVLLLEFCRVCGGDIELALPFAAALEMIHTYSLIHDDLPCMDNDDFRRGLPTNHKKFGEAAAVLAGDALLTAAFELMSGTGTQAERRLEALHIIAVASGAFGMAGGQDIDLLLEGTNALPGHITEMYRLKTGALIRAAAEAGCVLAGAADEQRNAAVTYAACVGLAFQLSDDLLDVEGDADSIGKAVGMDAERGKRTLVSALGILKSRAQIDMLTKEAVKALSGFNDNDFLVELAARLGKRKS